MSVTINHLYVVTYGFRLALTSMTLNGIERRNNPYFAFFTEFDCFAGQLRHSG